MLFIIQREKTSKRKTDKAMTGVITEKFENCSEEDLVVLDCVARGLDTQYLNQEIIERLKDRYLLSHLRDGTIVVPTIVWHNLNEFKKATGWHGKTLL